MNKINQLKMRMQILRRSHLKLKRYTTGFTKCILLTTLFVVNLGCYSEDQTVTNFTELTVQDEFDTELPNIVPEGQGQFMVLGGTLIEDLNDELDLNLHSEGMDTLSGLLIEHVGQMLSAGKKVDLNSRVKAEVVEVEGNRATPAGFTRDGRLISSGLGVTPYSGGSDPSKYIS